MKYRTALNYVAACLVLFIFSSVALGAEAIRLGKDELKGRLNEPEIVIVDVRSYTDWLFSGSKIKGASREDYRDYSAWADKYPKDKTIVLYCA